LGEPEAALAALVRARDVDALGFRADSTLQELTRRAAEGRGVLLVDLARDLEVRLYEADRLFWDHVHLTPEGNVQAALRIAGSLAPRLALRRPGIVVRDAPAASEVLRALLYTEWDRMQATAIMHQRYLAPPMNRLEDHTTLIEPLTEGLRTLRRVMSGERMERTIETYRAAVQREPRRLDMLERLIRLYAGAGRHAEAADAAEVLVNLAPHHRAGWSALGRARVRLGRVEEGFAAQQRGEALNPRGAEAAAGLEVAAELAADGHLELARSWFDRVIAADPAEARAWYNRGVLARRAGDHEQAAVDLRRALELDPTLAEAWNNLGVIALLEERNDEAIAALDRALALHPFSISALRNRAIAANLAGDWDTALALTRRLAPLDPDPGPAPPVD
jgi:tetratricopeptide (TPR) repeat protein